MLARERKAITVLSKKAVPSDLQYQREISNFGTLPVVDIALSTKAANQHICGLSLAEISKRLNLQ